MDKKLNLYDLENSKQKEEEMTKEYGCHCIVSDLVADRAGIDFSVFPRYQLMVRERKDPIVIRAIADMDALRNALKGS